MYFEKANRFDKKLVLGKIMGPNPLKLTEELLVDHAIPDHAVVLDLGSGLGLTSVFLARDYGFQVFAADLWSDPEENRRFFDSMGLSHEQITPVKADASALPFNNDFFDAVVCVDSYNFFGRDPAFLDDKLLPFVKPGGTLYISVPGMKKDCHANLPEVLLRSWTPEQLDYIHDINYWQKIFQASRNAELLSIHEMQCNEEAWRDWLASDNEYAINDRKTMLSGGLDFMNFIAIVLRKK